MIWIFLLLLALVALLAWQFRWHRQRNASEHALRAQIASLQLAQTESQAQERAQAEALFDSMAEGLLVLDPDGRIQVSNRALHELFNLCGELRGRTVLEVLRFPELADLVPRLAREDRILGCQLRPGGPDGACLEINATTIRDRAGQRRGTVLVFHDLTRLKQLERTSSEFVANVSHELRTPLSMIQGCAETLLDGAKDDPAASLKFLQTIERHAHRLALLIEDLLTSSEIEAGRAHLNLQSVALRPFAEKVLQDFSTRARERHIRLVNDLPELSVRADPSRLQQVFGNLLDNAIKYGGAQGTVTLRACPRDAQRVQVCVQDDGPGLPEEAAARVFERFYRVDKARSREAGGTGLGLSIVKDIIQAHGGEVWVESRPGEGAAFYFTLPRNGSGQPAAEEAQPKLL